MLLHTTYICTFSPESYRPEYIVRLLKDALSWRSQKVEPAPSCSSEGAVGFCKRVRREATAYIFNRAGRELNRGFYTPPPLCPGCESTCVYRHIHVYMYLHTYSTVYTSIEWGIPFHTGS
jgi:hypothetical protein